MINKTAFAKLDLAIHINPNKLKDGYYPVDYIVCQIDLSDNLSFQPKEKNIEIACNNPKIPKNKDNFVYKTAFLLKKIAGNKNLGTKIILKKNIPIKAGFGGGPSDAAVTLQGLQKLWNIKLNKNQILSLAKKLGKDFYYSLHGGLTEIQGKGKNYKVIPLLSHLPKFWLLIVIPHEEKPSTGWVYEHLNTKDIGRNQGKLANLKRAILRKDKNGILKNIFNDFETSVLHFYPVIKKIKSDLKKVGSLTALMAGAGLAVVGFFENKKTAQKAKQKLKDKYGQILISKII